MDTATLIAVDAVLSLRGIRSAARALGRPVSSVSASVSRFEAEVSVRLVERAGPGLSASLDAVRLESEIAAAAALARRISPVHAIKLDALERFAEIARRGSIRGAARHLALGQPQLTRQVAQLETRLGMALLRRGNGGSVVTAEGAQLAAASQDLLAAWRRLSRAAEERFRKAATTARLGSVIPLGYESEIARLLANLAARWLAQHPRAPLFVSSTTAEDLLAGLKTGQFDAALLDTEFRPVEFEGQVVGLTPLAVVGAGEAATDVAAALLAGPLAVPSARSGLRQRINRLLDDHLSEAERSAVRLIEIDSIPVILNLVLHHGFVSVLPRASVARIRGDLRLLPLPAGYDMTFWLCWPPGHGAIARSILAGLDPFGPD